jgi:hypothetical protein
MHGPNPLLQCLTWRHGRVCVCAQVLERMERSISDPTALKYVVRIQQKLAHHMQRRRAA